ncbi:MAG TPA: hypothetical protein VNS88_17555 [Nitrospiraceae bacterium]|nr:hypothetical protein [Nitrospiraceae bacterium]
MAGLPEDVINNLKKAAEGDPEAWRHPDLHGYPITGDDEEAVMQMYDESMNMVAPTPEVYKHAHAFMAALFGPDGYTPDSVGQLVEVFVPCLRIMVERGYEPTGGLWRKAGLLNIMGDVRKKFERYWFRTWTEGKRHDDSGFDLINFTAFTLRIDPDSRFGDAGEPASPETEDET